MGPQHEQWSRPRHLYVGQWFLGRTTYCPINDVYHGIIHSIWNLWLLDGPFRNQRIQHIFVRWWKMNHLKQWNNDHQIPHCFVLRVITIFCCFCHCIISFVSHSSVIALLRRWQLLLRCCYMYGTTRCCCCSSQCCTSTATHVYVRRFSSWQYKWYFMSDNNLPWSSSLLLHHGQSRV